MGATDSPAGGARVEITDAKLWVRRVRANPGIFTVQSEFLIKGGKLKYPIRKVRIQTATLDKGTREGNIEIGWNIQRPDRVIVGLVHADASAGDYTKNPFAFRHFNLNYVELVVEGMGEGQLYEPNFETESGCARPYIHLAAALESNETGKAFPLTIDEWKTKATLYAFDLKPSLIRDSGMGVIEEGTLRLKIRFSKGLAHSVTVVTYGKFVEMLETNIGREVRMISSIL